MRKIEAILIAAVIAGCALNAEPVKTFTAVRVTKDNIFSFGSAAVKVNPKLDYLNIAGTVKKSGVGLTNDPTKRDFYIFTRPGLNKIVLIETNTRGSQNPFQLPKDELMKDIPVIQKGKKPIDGRTWEIYVRSLPEYPAHIASAVRQKGIRMEPYRCGLEIGVGRVLDRFHRIYIKYIQGVDNCQTLPQNGGVLSDEQLRSIRELANEFDENITISDR